MSTLPSRRDVIEAGVTQSMLQGILVNDPRRFLAFAPKMDRGA